MSKRRGAIAIMAIFIFAIISLLAFVIFSRLEDNFLLIGTEKDEKQSSYYTESLAYLAKEGVKKDDLIKIIKHRGELDLSLPTFDGIKAEKAHLSPVKEAGAYTAVELEVASTYRRIRTVAKLRFKGVNPVFEQEDGVISVKEMKELGVYEPWQKILADDFSVTPPMGTTRWTTDRTMTLKREGRNFFQAFEDETQAPLSPIGTQLRWEVCAPVNVEEPLDMNGVLWLKEGAHIRGTIHLRGVLICEEGSVVDGEIIVDGLIIGDKSGSTRVNFQPRPVEETFCFFDEFIQPNHYRMKKLY